MSKIVFAGTTLLALAALAATATPAAAQTADGFSAGPGLDEGEAPDAGGPAPEWTQDRTFPGTRFWKLDAGRYEFEQWWRLRKGRDVDAYHILQTELAIGLTPRIQLDLYENLLIEDGELKHEGNQIEARIAIDPVYGRTPLNPVVYLEWHPRHLDADRAEVRLLGGEELIGPQLVGAVNLFYEQNVTHSPAGMGGTTYIPNPEAGFTGALSYAVSGPQLRVGGEVKFALEKEEFSDAEWETQLLAGPNVSSRIAGSKLKVFATVLFGITEDAKQLDTFLVLASEV